MTSQIMSSKAAKEENVIVPRNWWESLPRKVWGTLTRVKTSQPWFEVYKVRPGIHAIYEPYQFEETISYLIEGRETSILIDTGDGIADIKKCAGELTELPVTVLNTHAHVDHVAQNYMFSDVWAFDGPMAHAVLKVGYPNTKTAPMVGPGMTWKPLPKGFDSKKWVVPPYKVTKWLHDKDVVDIGTHKLEVIHTPGHSDDSVCLLDREERLLWVGDIFYTGGIYTYLAGGDLNQFISSYEKMVSLSPSYDYIMPSHNEPLVEKNILKLALEKAKSIRNGKERNYTVGNDEGREIRRYQYERFAIICAADQIRG